MWVPAYLKHLFWAGMKTTQRVESIHRFFDGYLSKHTLLSEFVERYVDALEVRSTSEKGLMTIMRGMFDKHIVTFQLNWSSRKCTRMPNSRRCKESAIA